MVKKKEKKPNKKADSKGAKTAGQPGTQAYEKQLLKTRDDILKIVKANAGEDLGVADVGDEADQASQSSERELLFELSDNERNTLDAVEAALRKIKTGGFGVCESCRQKIAAPRLHAIPHARYCIQCQARFDAPRR